MGIRRKRSKKPDKRKGAPKWATASFSRNLADLERLEEIVQLTTTGISGLRGMPRIVEVLAKQVPEHFKSPAEAESRLERVRKMAELARREVDTGFPLVYAQTVVSMWSLLEAWVQDFVVEWLAHNPSAIQSEPISKLRVQVGEYVQLHESERYYFLASLLEQELRTGIRNGAERFEMLLKVFGFGGEIPSKLRRDLFEFGQVRNAIAHRGGRSDRRLSEACPWLKTTPGVSVVVTKEMVLKYFQAAHCYTMIVVCRVGEHFGADMKESRDGLWKDYGEEYRSPELLKIGACCDKAEVP